MSDTPQPPPDEPESWPAPEGPPAGGPSPQGPSHEGPPPQQPPPPQQGSPPHQGPPPQGPPPQGPPPQQGPPPTGAGWGQPPAATPAATGAPVVVPAWVSSDWGSALWIAGIGQLLLLAGGVVITLFLLFASIASNGLDLVDWGAIAVSPLAITLGWSGAGEGAPLLITGVVYTFIAYRYAMRSAGHAVRTVLASRPRAFAHAGKVGVVSAGILLAVGILLNSFAEELLRRASGFWAARILDLTSLVFFSLFVGALVSLVALLSVGRVSLIRLLGLRTTTPAPVRLGALGARRALLVGGVGLLVLHTLGSLLDDLSQGGLGLGDVVTVLLNTVASLLSTWLDTAVLLLLGATKFLHAGGYVWTPTSEVAGWMWLAIPVLLAAYIAGGVRAARAAQPTTQAEAAKAALLVGPVVAVVGLLAALGWSGQPSIEDIVPIAILLPTLWGLAALLGAWLWANQQGLGSGLVVERPQDQPPPPAGQDPTGWGPPPTPQPAPSADETWDPPHGEPWGPPTGDAWGPPAGPPVYEQPSADQQRPAPSPEDSADHGDSGSEEGPAPESELDLGSLPPPDPSDRSQG